MITNLPYITSICDIDGITKFYQISTKAEKALDETNSIETYWNNGYKHIFACEKCLESKNIIVKQVIENTIKGTQDK